jgi:indole-3-glycerol phosphate synthase
MTSEFLTMSMERRRNDVAAIMNTVDIGKVRGDAKRLRMAKNEFSLATALSRSDTTNIIAEIKRASPSKGVINAKINPADVARAYEAGGACAISVLTEPEYFLGSIEDLRAVAASIAKPILRKDFTVDEFQIYEAAAAGADAILLIVAGLSVSELRHLFDTASEIGIDAVVEVHNEAELDVASSLGARIVGVNNRDLQTLDVSLETSRKLIRSKPEGVLMISESGITDHEEIMELKGLGYDGFLVGESLMRAKHAGELLKAWM